MKELLTIGLLTLGLCALYTAVLVGYWSATGENLPGGAVFLLFVVGGVVNSATTHRLMNPRKAVP
jgi:uncharacterized integral membrane protein